MTDPLTPEQDAALSAVMPEVVKAIASAVSSGTWKSKPIAEAVLSLVPPYPKASDQLAALIHGRNDHDGPTCDGCEAMAEFLWASGFRSRWMAAPAEGLNE